jgi:hypothetical protein
VAQRLPDTVRPPTTVESEPGGFRSLARIAAPLPRRPSDAAMVATGDDLDGASPQPTAALTEIGS